MTRRKQTERELRVENRRLLAALSTIHDRLHADDVNGAHEMCECALEGGAVTQANITGADAAAGMRFAAEFNALIDRHRLRACCIQLVPSMTVKNAVSLQICGETVACKVVEEKLRGSASLYMGDHG
jgi:hypothetical protein